ncbi:hypothetical protein [Xanthobacter sediminis]
MTTLAERQQMIVDRLAASAGAIFDGAPSAEEISAYERTAAAEDLFLDAMVIEHAVFWEPPQVQNRAGNVRACLLHLSALKRVHETPPSDLSEGAQP